MNIHKTVRYGIGTFTLLTAIAAAALITPALHAAEPAELFSAFTSGSRRTADHGSWDALLGRYLVTDHPSGINLFNYGSFGAEDRAELEGYLQSLQSINPIELDRDEQMAFWINLYNALTVKVILDRYPVDSIRNISLPGSRGGPWKALLVNVNGVDLSLDDIEHGILRPIWKDPRIHYAVNCASMGCPNLAPEAYTAAKLESMLENAARSYINHPRGVSRDGNRLRLSSIYNWYSEDFGGREGPKSHLLMYADAETRTMIESSSGGFKYTYDWSLNAP